MYKGKKGCLRRGKKRKLRNMIGRFPTKGEGSRSSLRQNRTYFVKSIGGDIDLHMITKSRREKRKV